MMENLKQKHFLVFQYFWLKPDVGKEPNKVEKICSVSQKLDNVQHVTCSSSTKKLFSSVPLLSANFKLRSIKFQKHITILF